jgi:hypothetical protein
MQYLLQIFTSADTSGWERLSEGEQQAITDEYLALRAEPGYVGGAQLQPADTATTVRVEDGRTLTTDGPFPESREVLAGYYLFDVDDLDAALALAARIPAARTGGAIEVRALVPMK